MKNTVRSLLLAIILSSCNFNDGPKFNLGDTVQIKGSGILGTIAAMTCDDIFGCIYEVCVGLDDPKPGSRYLQLDEVVLDKFPK